MGAHAEKPVIRALGIDDRVAGQTGLAQVRLLLTQHFLAVAAMFFAVQQVSPKQPFKMIKTRLIKSSKSHP